MDGVLVTLNHLSELVTVPFEYSKKAILIYMVLHMPFSVLESGITNVHGIHCCPRPRPRIYT